MASGLALFLGEVVFRVFLARPDCRPTMQSQRVLTAKCNTLARSRRKDYPFHGKVENR